MTDPLARLATALSRRYRLERELGQGGMATVYLAEDLKHKRKVALKVLKPELATVLGAERFVQEITTTAALQHPHILPLFDSGTADGFLFYVMPFIDGETLRARLDRETQLGVDDAVRIAREVLDALAYAHQHGIVHRDVKPENILLHGGHALVADFGIALAVSAAAGGRMTETGLSLGTPHYMSPEQATAEKDITGRSDIYSLGSVLYEMLAGQPPHLGGSAQQIVMKIIAEPVQPVTTHRKSVPPNVAGAVAKALEKLPADRFDTAKSFSEALANPGYVDPTFAHATAGSATPGRRGVSATAFAAMSTLAVAAIAVALWGWLRPVPPKAVTSRYALSFPRGQERRDRRWLTFALAPDGAWLVYTGPSPGPDSSGSAYRAGADQLWIKPRGQIEATGLTGTVDGYAPTPSPDGQWIAFVSTSGQLRKISVAGGAPITVADSVSANGGSSAAWGDDDVITWVDGSSRLRRVAGVGGTSSVAWTPPAGQTPTMLTALPKGRGVLFGLCPGRCLDKVDLWVLDLRSRQAKLLVTGAVKAWYAAGRLVFIRPDGAVFGQGFDLGSLALTGAVIPLFDGVRVIGGLVPQAALGGDGSLLYLRGPAERAEAEAVWVGRDGRATPVDTSWGFLQALGGVGWALSPDGKRLAIGLSTNGRDQIWVKELDRGPASRITFDSSGDVRPGWMPDGHTVTYLSRRGGAGLALYGRNADGTGAEALKLKVSGSIFEAVWSRNGKWLVLRTGGVGSEGNRDVYAMRLGVDSVPRPLLATPAQERAVALSPDGRWLAYTSDESGRDEVYVRPFPNVDEGKWQVSLTGGGQPLWAHSGREIFYRSAANEMMVAQVSGSPGFPVANRHALFSLNMEILDPDPNFATWDVSPDDQRFFMVRWRAARTDQSTASLILVTNWLAELEAKVK